MDSSRSKGAEFLGTGLAFPPTFQKREHRAANDILLVEGEQDIQESLQIILSTRPGERPLQPDFGCNLDQLLFEPLTLSLISLMQETVRTALIRHEHRIVVDDVRIDTTESLEGRVLISVDYTVRSKNSRFNFVFPFYREEGTDIRR